MTEAEWLTSNDPDAMLAYLGGRAGARKLRLFEVACCWAIWPLLDHHQSESAIEMATLDADGLVSTEAMQQAARGANDAYANTNQDTESDSPIAPLLASKAAYLLVAAPEERVRLRSTPRESAALALAYAELDRLRPPVPYGGLGDLQGTGAEKAAYESGLAAARTRQANELRDLFGNPFRPALLILEWLQWSGGIIPNLAQSIYDEHAFATMSSLGEALQEAGCDNLDILDHCQKPGGHVRGCWVIDLLLGKG
jgi:hypothetical protein